jgi:hypothetical protein
MANDNTATLRRAFGGMVDDIAASDFSLFP